jgi:hypothetical protein
MVMLMQDQDRQRTGPTPQRATLSNENRGNSGPAEQETALTQWANRRSGGI